VKRGDVITAVLPGELGKPRPAIIIETDRLAPTDSVLLCLVTSHVRENLQQRRILVEPSPTNGLRLRSQIQADKIYALRRSKCGERIGALNSAELEQLNEALALVIGLAD
jgi:mRNA interferase MazF